jgi:hypothetical protein
MNLSPGAHWGLALSLLIPIQLMKSSGCPGCSVSDFSMCW